ncbi:cytochrome b5 [Citrus sinensis]|uniref:Cytochrome b5 n=1 Tax=Citrus sinensis TaxID=2711 RepID=A0ACB8MGY6_CITSI|nr:cytochrome b5 [Citrus sinensis]
MGGEGKVYTLAEVSGHNDRKDCWLIIEGKIVPVGSRRMIAGSHKANNGLVDLSVSTVLDSLICLECNAYGNGLIAMKKSVYDVTKFLDDHPGGDEVLLSATGKDATDDFEDVGHSSSAKAMMDEFYVGDIDSSTVPTKTKYTPPKQPHYNQDKTPEFIIKLLQFLVPLLILGLAVGIRFYTKSA